MLEKVKNWVDENREELIVSGIIGGMGAFCYWMGYKTCSNQINEGLTRMMCANPKLVDEYFTAYDTVVTLREKF